MFNRVLVANRGEIARRVFRTCRALGVETVACYSDADEKALHTLEADQAVFIGASSPSESYLDVRRVVQAAKESGAEAVHPGYGFLSESPSFARAVIAAGMSWIGPHPDTIEEMGDKINARNRVQAAGVPVSPGTSEPISEVEIAVEAARDIGYPIMIKAAAGGGGIGMSIATDEPDLRELFETTRTRAERSFGDSAILLEKYVRNARHVEVQILGYPDDRGVIALGERDCSVQRRHQKVVEETPAPGLSAALRSRMMEAAVAAGHAVDYLGAGTVEFLVSGTGSEAEFMFLEMNTRLQVEHPITELVTGIDLVEQQLRVASSDFSDLPTLPVRPEGVAIEFRIYAEDPVRFLPRPGTITAWSEPSGEGIRVDSGYQSGDEVTPYYDPLLAKLSVVGRDRSHALSRAATALNNFLVEGVQTNLPFLLKVLAAPEFQSGTYDTGLVQIIQSRD